MFNNPVARASLSIIWAGMLVAYLGSWAFLWLLTFGFLFLLGVVFASMIFGSWGADIVAFFAMGNLFNFLGRQFKAFKDGSL